LSEFIVTACPAASTIEPFSTLIVPSLLILGATKTTSPPLLAEIKPWFRISAAFCKSANRILPLMKSWLEILRVDAINPAVLTIEFLPKTIPFGLTRKTLPLELSCPRMRDGSCPTMRLRMALLAPCWINRVISPWLMPNCCQLTMAPGVLVILRVWLFGWLNETEPCTTVAPPGLACEPLTTDKARQTPQTNELSVLTISIFL